MFTISGKLTYDDFVQSATPEKGAETRIAISAPGVMIPTPLDNKSPIDTTGVKYLRKMIEECQSRNIDVMLTYLPFPAKAKNQAESHLCYDLAEEYGVKYVNFLDLDDIVNYQVDCYDDASHLNPSGARKVTSYLGNYITSNFDLQDKRNEPDYQSWNTDYTAYKDFKFNNLNEQTQLDLSLMLLADKNINTCIYVKGDSGILENEYYTTLLQNLNTTSNLSKIQDAINSHNDYLLIIDNGNFTVHECTNISSLQQIEASFHLINYNNDQAGNVSLTFDDGSENHLTNTSNNKLPDALVIGFDKFDGQLIYEADFTITSKDKRGNLTILKNETTTH